MGWGRLRERQTLGGAREPDLLCSPESWGFCGTRRAEHRPLCGPFPCLFHRTVRQITCNRTSQDLPLVQPLDNVTEGTYLPSCLLSLDRPGFPGELCIIVSKSGIVFKVFLLSAFLRGQSIGKKSTFFKNRQFIRIESKNIFSTLI